MILNALQPGFYAPTNQLLLKRAQRDTERLREQWQDEASEAALAGRPERAGYIEHMARRLL
jgi:hypothetical protein